MVYLNLRGDIYMPETEKPTVFFERRKREALYKMSAAHTHSFHELYFLLNGSTKYFINNEIILLNAGDMIFIPKTEYHQTDYGESAVTERIIFCFDDDFVGEEFKCYIDAMAEDKFITFGKEGLQKIIELVCKIENENVSDEIECKKMQKLYFQQLLIFISRYRKKSDVRMLPSTMLLMQKIAKYISDNPAADLSLEQLSKIFSISPFYLSKAFKFSTGVGLNEYINTSRITVAEKLLASTEMTVAAVATECGFNDSNYFSAVFKRIVGITPKKYSVLHKNK